MIMPSFWIKANPAWTKYRRHGLPWWPELEIFSNSSACGDRGLSQSTAATPRTTNLGLDQDDLEDTDVDEEVNPTAPKRRLDRKPTDRRKKSQSRSITNSAMDFRKFVAWRMEKGASTADSATVRPADPLMDGPNSVISCQKLLDTLKDIPKELYVMAQQKIHSDAACDCHSWK
ncbi:uncharacterized protein LOC122061547 [Macadamia integrifolia]|uniref:uncharacterized protein LOC122061547 n=1 Tax=Macadamia integrifolia TaxID=60698 RepID=UPI001C52BE65|nr:uncharacterized protein LOC122061547 [Macadamia integrifolia]